LFPCAFSVTLIEDKIERQPFWYNWGDWGRIAKVLNTLTGQTSRMHLKNGRSTGNDAYAQKGTNLTVIVANRPKSVSDQIAAAPVVLSNWTNCKRKKEYTQNLQTLMVSFSQRAKLHVHKYGCHF
jgi:hypothetical protein